MKYTVERGQIADYNAIWISLESMSCSQSAVLLRMFKLRIKNYYDPESSPFLLLNVISFDENYCDKWFLFYFDHSFILTSWLQNIYGLTNQFCFYRRSCGTVRVCTSRYDKCSFLVILEVGHFQIHSFLY